VLPELALTEYLNSVLRDVLGSAWLREPGPQSSERSRQMVHEFRKLAGIDLFPEDIEHSAGHGRRIHGKLWWQFFQNAVGKFLGAASFGGLSGHVPALLVDATHQHRKLSPETDRDLRGQPVTQCMQHRPHRIVSLVRSSK
jgi:hypothetical protein